MYPPRNPNHGKPRRGRKSPDYGPYFCFFCTSLQRLNVATRRYFCPCGWEQ
jgi:hypothetical protein